MIQYVSFDIEDRECLNLKSIQDLRSLALLQIDSCLNLRSISDIRRLHSLQCRQTTSCFVEVLDFSLI